MVEGLVKEINSHDGKDVRVFDYEKCMAEMKGEDATLNDHEKSLINMAVGWSAS